MSLNRSVASGQRDNPAAVKIQLKVDLIVPALWLRPACQTHALARILAVIERLSAVQPSVLPLQ
jgi:hypothetical protein